MRKITGILLMTLGVIILLITTVVFIWQCLTFSPWTSKTGDAFAIYGLYKWQWTYLLQKLPLGISLLLLGYLLCFSLPRGRWAPMFLGGLILVIGLVGLVMIIGVIILTWGFANSLAPLYGKWTDWMLSALVSISPLLAMTIFAALVARKLLLR